MGPWTGPVGGKGRHVSQPKF